MKRSYWLIVAAQLAIIAVVAGIYQYGLSAGQAVWLKSIPYDPSDVFYGNHYNLRFGMNSTEVEDWSNSGIPGGGSTVYVTLKPVENGLDHSVVSVSQDEPDQVEPDQIVVHAKTYNTPATDPLGWKSDRIIVNPDKVKNYDKIKFNQHVCIKETYQDHQLIVLSVESACDKVSITDHQYLESARVTNYAVEEHAPLDLEIQQTYLPSELVHLKNQTHTQAACLVSNVDANGIQLEGVYDQCPATLKNNQFARTGRTYKQLELEYGIEQFYVPQFEAVTDPAKSGDLWLKAVRTPWGQLVPVETTEEKPTL